VEHFFQSLVNTSGMTLHIRQVLCDSNLPKANKIMQFHEFLLSSVCGPFHNSFNICLLQQLAGENSHHIIEATFKAFARALRQATETDPRRGGTIPRFD